MGVEGEGVGVRVEGKGAWVARCSGSYPRTVTLHSRESSSASEHHAPPLHI